MIYKRKSIFLISALFVVIFFISHYFLKSMSGTGSLFASNFLLLTSAKSPDAIAIRVIPNPKHYSARRWYEEQGFSGSPQALTVDGYEAARDGRTVYVNVGNLKNNVLGTDIYLISYNQAAEGATIDIFSQILSHWKFNTNISDIGLCDSAVSAACADDSDCLSGEFCLSSKAKLIRDTKRLADLIEITNALEDYKEKNNRYPELTAGSYVPRKTISTWPSWQNALAKALDFNLPLDPINKLGACAGYDPVTCWDQEDKKFADPDPDNDEFELPAGSYVYAYKAADDGLSYDLYQSFESNDTGYCRNFCKGGNITNNPPDFINVNLPIAYSGEFYEGFIQASDDNSDNITWISDIPWSDWEGEDKYLWEGVSREIEDTAVADMKKIKAVKAGVADADSGASYEFSVTVDDNKGAIRNRIFTIPVVNRNLPVISDISPKTVSIGKDLSFTIQGSEDDGQYPLEFTFEGRPIGLGGDLDMNERDYNISGQVLDITKEYLVTVTAKDYYQGPSYKNFTVTVTNKAPGITTDSPLPSGTACGGPYSAKVEAKDPDGHAVSYNAQNLPNGLKIDAITGNISGKINEQIGGAVDIKDSKQFNPTIIAADEYSIYTKAPYSAESQKPYSLTVEDEVFSVNVDKASDKIYGWPGGNIELKDLYHKKVTYSGLINNSASGPVTYSLQNNPGWMNINNNIIKATTENNNSDGVYNVKVAAVNNCGAAYSADIALTVKKNEWCGDTIRQLNPPDPYESEECDDGKDMNDKNQCFDNCKNTYCGDGIQQEGKNGKGFKNSAPNTDGFEEQCDDGANNKDPYTLPYSINKKEEPYCDKSCQNVTATGPYCGDTKKNGPEECDDGRNSNDYDKCYNDCKNTYCGDGKKQTPNGKKFKNSPAGKDPFNEQCDDGANNKDSYTLPYSQNKKEEPYCDKSCQNATATSPYCGDTKKNGPEECDWKKEGDGSPCVPPYGGSCNYCSKSCKWETVTSVNYCKFDFSKFPCVFP